MCIRGLMAFSQSVRPASALLPCVLLLCAGPIGAFAETPPRSSAPIRGLVRAVGQAAIAIDFPVRVAELHVREAESFRRGQLLVTFDCKRLRSEHAAAAATAREMRLTLQSQTYLDQRGAAGKLDVEVSRARFDRAEAEAAAIAARLEQCTLIAPFDGRVSELKINEHEIPASGQPFISLVDETRFEIDLLVPSYALRVLQTGTQFRFEVDETGAVHEAAVLRLGAAVDPVSQSIKVIASFKTLDARIVAGMSGTAVIAELEAVR